MFRLEVIDYIDQTGQALVARVPEIGTAAIQLGAQLIVQQNQEAVFFRDGRAMDSFGAGRHTLSTANIPILGKLLTIPWEKSPFQACVYFVGKQRFIDQRWGTRHPITMKDPDFGLVRLRGFGKNSFRVVDAPLLINEIVGTQGKFTTDEIGNYLRDLLVSGLTDLLATSNIGLLQMAAKFDELAAAARFKIGDQFSKFGLELTDFVINSISPPEEVQKAIDARSSMAAIGDLRSYTLYQAANGIAGAGGADGGGAAAIGMGAGFGMMMPSLLQQAMQQAPASAAPPQLASPAAAPTAGAAPSRPALDFSQLAPSTDSIANVKQALKAIAGQANWPVDDSQAVWLITVSVGSLRKQKVHVDFAGVDDEGHKLVSFWSSCGAVNPSQAMMLLRYNSQIVHGAFAIQNIDGRDLLVLRGNLLADTADVLELTRTLTAIAWQADRVEEQMFGVDDA
jgi:membrane protease subunit (stomatin/prohibitin family)